MLAPQKAWVRCVSEADQGTGCLHASNQTKTLDIQAASKQLANQSFMHVLDLANSVEYVPRGAAGKDRCEPLVETGIDLCVQGSDQ